MIKSRSEIDFNDKVVEILGSFTEMVAPRSKTETGSNRPSTYKFMIEESGEILIVRSFIDMDDLVWKNIENKDLYKITAKSSLYQGNIEQLLITHYEEVEEKSKRKVIQGVIIDDIRSEIMTLIKNNVKNEEFLKILRYFMGDSDSGFYTWPAATGFHHAYRGGLAEHSLSVAKLSMGLFDNFQSKETMSRELTITGALLHDIGKLREYSEDKFYQEDGNLYGHLLMGVEMINEAVYDLGLDIKSDRVRALKHIIASHHVDPAKGAIVRPVLREALLIGNADNLDAMDNHLVKYIGSTDDGSMTERVANHGGVRYWKHTIID